MSVLIRVIRIYHVILFVSFSLCMIRKNTGMAELQG